MRKLGHLLKASGVFVKELLRPKDRVAGYSPNGHTLLEGWEEAPEERILARCQQQQKLRRAQPRRLALYCFDGAHQGEILFAGKSFETLGRAKSSSLVMTPVQNEDFRSYQLMINGVRTLIAEPGTVFKLNGHEEQQGELFDYDEVELLGNRFLALQVDASPKEMRGQS
ncbi:MAG: hypothetical protein H6617_11970 [Bdellovibrionaceae bacterium]|nr:hypothetical protein [Bdellovibrionales bacterium]MCB9255390.1 hypothetical protein [Pseudobdellovibrionaceae bacterium]